MSELIEHRGPDGHGLWTSSSGRAVLAHRRLAVIDLSTGAQPMLARDGALAVTFNGEIYNYVELRERLRACGHVFHTDSDTEVLLAAVAERGPAAVEDLRGMFAFAAWDESAGRLTLARDRLGKKPLYHVVDGDVLYFCSSLKALVNTSSRRGSVDRDAVIAYLALGYVPAPATIHAGVAKLEAGTILTTTLDGPTTVARYWSPATGLSPFSGSFEEAVERTRQILTESVRLRLQSDVPLGLFLSGGVDSSLIAAVARLECGTELETFSIGFEDAGHDETASASLVAQHLGTRHRNFRGSADLISLVPRAVSHFGEPLADPAVLPLWVLAQATRRHVTVALGGDGGDEAFGGYHWYHTAERLARVRSLAGGRWLAGFRSRVGVALHHALPAGGIAGRIARGAEATAYADPGEAYAELRSLFSSRDRQRVMEGSREVNVDITCRLYHAAKGGPLRKMRAADIGTYLGDCLNPKVDVATMAHALEARAPLLDHRVIEFGMSLPEDFLRDKRGGKRVLRALLGRYLPTEIMSRPKHGFSVPLEEWFSGPLRESAAALGSSERLASISGMKMEGVRQLVGEHLGGVRAHGDRIYALYVLDTWIGQQ